MKRILYIIILLITQTKLINSKCINTCEPHKDLKTTNLCPAYKCVNSNNGKFLFYYITKRSMSGYVSKIKDLKTVCQNYQINTDSSCPLGLTCDPCKTLVLGSTGTKQSYIDVAEHYGFIALEPTNYVLFGTDKNFVCQTAADNHPTGFCRLSDGRDYKQWWYWFDRIAIFYDSISTIAQNFDSDQSIQSWITTNKIKYTGKVDINNKGGLNMLAKFLIMGARDEISGKRRYTFREMLYLILNLEGKTVISIEAGPSISMDINTLFRTQRFHLISLIQQLQTAGLRVLQTISEQPRWMEI